MKIKDLNYGSIDLILKSNDRLQIRELLYSIENSKFLNQYVFLRYCRKIEHTFLSKNRELKYYLRLT